MKAEIRSSSQFFINPEWLLASKVRQFWDPRHHEAEEEKRYLTRAYTELYAQRISTAQTIGEAKRIVMESYAWVRGTSHQGKIQDAVRARKSELRHRRQEFGGAASDYGLDKHW